MAKTIGRRGNLGIGTESTVGTTTTIKAWVPFLSVDLSERHTPIGDMSARGIRDEQGPEFVEGKKWGEGSVEVVLDAEVAPYFLLLAMGTYASSTSGIYIHTFSRKTANDPLTATIYRDRDVDVLLFPNSVVNTLEVSFADDVAKLTANILSKFPVEEDTETPSYADLDLFTWRNAEVEVNNAGSTSALKVREFNLQINNNVEPIFAPNDNNVDSLAMKQFGVSGSMVVDFENATQRDFFHDLTDVKLTVSLLESTHKITFTMPKVFIDNDEISTPIDDISQENINFVATHDGTESLSIEVRNDVLESYT